ncbi:hypothetical protein D3C76_769210 [compost metagenome]
MVGIAVEPVGGDEDVLRMGFVDLVEKLFLRAIDAVAQQALQVAEARLQVRILHLERDDPAVVIGVDLAGLRTAVLQRVEAQLDHLAQAFVIFVTSDHQHITTGHHEHRLAQNRRALQHVGQQHPAGVVAVLPGALVQTGQDRFEGIGAGVAQVVESDCQCLLKGNAPILWRAHGLGRGGVGVIDCQQGRAILRERLPGQRAGRVPAFAAHMVQADLFEHGQVADHRPQQRANLFQGLCCTGVAGVDQGAQVTVEHVGFARFVGVQVVAVGVVQVEVAAVAVVQAKFICQVLERLAITTCASGLDEGPGKLILGRCALEEPVEKCPEHVRNPP